MIKSVCIVVGFKLFIALIEFLINMAISGSNNGKLKIAISAPELFTFEAIAEIKVKPEPNKEHPINRLLKYTVSFLIKNPESLNDCAGGMMK